MQVISSIDCYQSQLVYLTVEHCLARKGGARGVTVIVRGNGHDDTSSNPGRNWLHFT